AGGAVHQPPDPGPPSGLTREESRRLDPEGGAGELCEQPRGFTMVVHVRSVGRTSRGAAMARAGSRRTGAAAFALALAVGAPAGIGTAATGAAAGGPAASPPNGGPFPVAGPSHPGRAIGGRDGPTPHAQRWDGKAGPPVPN